MSRLRYVSDRLLVVYAIYLGVIVGLFSSVYYYLLKWGTNTIWHNLSTTNEQLSHYGWIITTIGGLLVGLAVKYFSVSGGMSEVVGEIHESGYLNYKKIPGMLIASLLSLIAGSSVGPEAPLVDINGSIGSLLGKKLKLNQEQLRTLTFCGISAALGAFFGSPLGSAIFALEIPHRFGLEYYESFIPVVVSAIVGFLVFRFSTGLTIGGQYKYPHYSNFAEGLHAQDILYALLIGVICAATAFLFIAIFRLTGHLVSPLKKNPVLLNTLGGLGIGIAAFFVPLSLFYGEDQIQTIIDQGFQMGLGSLLILLLVKSLTVSLSIHSGFRGGFVFPVFLIGVTLGSVISLVFPFIPPTVSLVCATAALAAALLKTPVSMIIVISVISGTHVIPLVTVSVITSLLLTVGTGIVSTQKPRPRIENNAEP